MKKLATVSFTYKAISPVVRRSTCVQLTPVCVVRKHVEDISPFVHNNSRRTEPIQRVGLRVGLGGKIISAEGLYRGVREILTVI